MLHTTSIGVFGIRIPLQNVTLSWTQDQKFFPTNFSENLNILLSIDHKRNKPDWFDSFDWINRLNNFDWINWFNNLDNSNWIYRIN